MRNWIALGLVAALAACGGGGGSDGGSGGPPTPTALQIKVSITRLVNEPDGTTGIVWMVSVRNNGVGVNTATVTIAGQDVPRKVGFSDGDYWLEYQQNPVNISGTATYVPGQDYTVTVSVGGSAYTDTLRVPGGFTLDPAGASVAWAQPGNVAQVLVSHLFGATTFTTATQGANPPSPVAIPASAYPSADTYEISAMVQNKRWPVDAYPGNGYFASLVGPDTYFYVQDGYLKRVTK